MHLLMFALSLGSTQRWVQSSRGRGVPKGGEFCMQRCHRGGLGSPAAQGKPTSVVWALNGSFSSGRGSAKSWSHCFSPAQSVLRVSHSWDGCWRESGGVLRALWSHSHAVPQG